MTTKAEGQKAGRRTGFAQPRLLAFALALITILVYLPVRQHAFINFDDPEYITDNRIVQAGLTGPGVKWAFTSLQDAMWLPLTRLSEMLDCELFGLDAGAHHLVNVLFHAANAALLLGLLLRLTGALWPSAMAAALFAWHPLRVESVAWAVERKDVLSTLFLLLTLWAWVEWVSSRTTDQRGANQGHKDDGRKTNDKRGTRGDDIRRSRPIWYGLALGAFALALLSKAMVVTVPFVLLLLDYWPLRRLEDLFSAQARSVIPRLVLEKLPFFLLSGVAIVFSVLAAQGQAAGLGHYPFSWRFANALVSYARYLGKTFWPSHLAVLYPLPTSWPMSAIVSAAALLVAATWLCWHFRRSRPHLLIGWLWFLGMLVPVIGVMQVGRQAMADRFTYVPLIGLFLAIVLEAQYWLVRWRIPGAVTGLAAGGILIACLGATAHQLRYWVDSETLFKHAIAVTGDNGVANLNLGVALEESGRPEEALKEYREAARLVPNYAQVHNNLANLLSAMGRTTDALAEYREGLRRDPKAPLLHDNIGTLLVQLGQFDEAMREYAAAANLAQGDPRPHYLMGKACLRQGRPKEAIDQFRQALSLDGNDLQTLIFFARVRAAYPDAAVRNGAEAVALAEKSNGLSGGARPFVLDTLAMAYAEAGRFAEAQQAQQQAINLATTAGETNVVAELQARLRLYQAGQPYRNAFAEAPQQTGGPK